MPFSNLPIVKELNEPVVHGYHLFLFFFFFFFFFSFFCVFLFFFSLCFFFFFFVFLFFSLSKTTLSLTRPGLLFPLLRFVFHFSRLILCLGGMGFTGFLSLLYAKRLVPPQPRLPMALSHLAPLTTGAHGFACPFSMG